MPESRGLWGGETITVSKLEAAVSQLDAAIVLWFGAGDIVAIHTLAAASHQIIHDINRKSGGRDLIYDSLVIAEEYQKEWVNRIKAPMNFFKHADKDPDPNARIEFHTSTIFLYFLFSSMGLRQIGLSQSTLAQSAFASWVQLHHPQLVKPEHRMVDLIPIEDLERMKGIGRNEFFEIFKRVWGRANT